MGSDVVVVVDGKVLWLLVVMVLLWRKERLRLDGEVWVLIRLVEL